jgi:hypothetical protein
VMVGVFLVAAALTAVAVPPALAMARRGAMLPEPDPDGTATGPRRAEREGADDVEPTLAL